MNLKPLLCLALVLFIYRGDAAIIFPQGPAGGWQVAYEDVAYFCKTSPAFFGGTQIGELAIGNCYQCYNPQQVAPGHLLASAEIVSNRWLYLVMRGTNAVMTAELKAANPARGAFKLVSLRSHPAAEIQKALQAAEKWPRVQKQDYEFRFLNMPPLEFFAVWLHGKSDDIIVPLAPTWGMWHADLPYSEAEIVKILEPMLEQEMKAPPGTVN
jgi:hypothetical protein